MQHRLKLIRELLPDYTVAVYRHGRLEFRFQLPKKVRPEGWSATIRLPLDEELRTGRGDAAELNAVLPDAQMLYKRFEDARKLGLPVKPDEPSFGSLPWLASIYREDQHDDFGYRSLKPSTKADYDTYINRIIEWSDEVRKAAGMRDHPSVSLISYQHIRPFLRRFSNRPRTQERIRQMLDTLFQVAVAEAVISINPMKETAKLKKRGGRKKKTVSDVLWTTEEHEAFFEEALKQGRKGVFIVCAWMRWQAHRQIDGALLHRSWFEGDPLSAEWIRFDISKTVTDARIPSSAEFRQCLRLAFADGIIPFGHMAVNEDTGLPYISKTGRVSRAFNKHVRQILEPLGLGHKKVSHLRHTAIIEMARAGLSVHQIRSRTRHSIKTVVDILEHYLPPDEALSLEATLQLADWRKEQSEKGGV
jgi:hypothetical protein